MPLRLGIGIVTCNRNLVLGETLDRIQRHTRHRDTAVVVADDGSSDGTLDMLRARGVATITGANMGIAWNKNRALFALSELFRCDVMLLLEDDTYPVRDSWEIEWLNATVRWGHANVAGDWLREHFLSGSGTLDDPILSLRFTAQCTAFSREALLFGGYLDTRFRGTGHEHVEHTSRLIRMGYGGVVQTVKGVPETLVKLLWGGLGFAVAPSLNREAEAKRNLVIAHRLFGDRTYRAPWRNEDEARQFRDEMRSGIPNPLL